jgi:hypothetical protein
LTVRLLKPDLPLNRPRTRGWRLNDTQDSVGQWWSRRPRRLRTSRAPHLPVRRGRRPRSIDRSRCDRGRGWTKDGRRPGPGLSLKQRGDRRSIDCGRRNRVRDWAIDGRGCGSGLPLKQGADRRARNSTRRNRLRGWAIDGRGCGSGLPLKQGGDRRSINSGRCNRVRGWAIDGRAASPRLQLKRSRSTLAHRALASRNAWGRSRVHLTACGLIPSLSELKSRVELRVVHFHPFATFARARS